MPVKGHRFKDAVIVNITSLVPSFYILLPQIGRKASKGLKLEALLFGHSKKPLLCILLLYSSQEQVSRTTLSSM